MFLFSVLNRTKMDSAQDFIPFSNSKSDPFYAKRVAKAVAKNPLNDSRAKNFIIVKSNGKNQPKRYWVSQPFQQFLQCTTEKSL